MLVLVGLGNPGPKYERHRHNIGFMAVDAIHRRQAGFAPWRKRFQAEVSEGQIAGRKVMLIKPSTYMNESGRAVGEALRFFKLAAEDVTVFYDDLDLAPGRVRIKVGGGAGGHNGLRSLDAHIGKGYRRVRLGIGHPGSKELVTNHVLGDFAKADAAWLEPLMDAVAGEIGLLVEGNTAEYMNRLHRATPSGQQAPVPREKNQNQSARGRSHIPQARSNNKPTVPKEGPLAAMLKGLLGPKNSE